MSGLVPARCRSCGADIWWGRTKAGKRIPVNREPVPDGNVVFAGWSPRHGNCVDVRAPGDNESAYVSHFTTCPNANEWRSGK